MKHWCILICVCGIITVCYGQSSTRSLAKANLSAAMAAVQIQSPNAVLYSITSQDSVQADGTSSNWLYGFYSKSVDSIYTYGIYAYNGSVYTGVSGRSAGDTAYLTISSSTQWLNSDAIMALAEQNGGSTFRTTHSNVTISMILKYGQYTGDPSRLVWIVSYFSGTEVFFVIVDAVTGQVLVNGTPVAEPVVSISNASQLSQNYPNPFTASTAISFSLMRSQYVSLRVYNALGEMVQELANNMMNAGKNTAYFNIGTLPEGVYYYRLMADGTAQTKRMVIIK